MWPATPAMWEENEVSLLAEDVCGKIDQRTFVETSFGEDAVGGGEMLFAINSFLLERGEFWIRSDL